MDGWTELKWKVILEVFLLNVESDYLSFWYKLIYFNRCSHLKKSNFLTEACTFRSSCSKSIFLIELYLLEKGLAPI